MSMNRIPPEGMLLKRSYGERITVLGIYMGCIARKPKPHVVVWFWGSLAALGDALSVRYDEQTLMLFSRA